MKNEKFLLRGRDLESLRETRPVIKIL